MSVINRMLRDLDRRHALPDSVSAGPGVRVVPHAGRSDAFWITLGVLALVSVGWLSWVVYQLQPRPLATALAFSRPPVPPPTIASGSPAPPVPPAPTKEPPANATASEPPPPPPELFRLAESIETPIAAPSRKSVPKPVRLPPDQAFSPAGTDGNNAAGQFTKRDRPLSNPEEAELRFQKGVDRLNQGRASAAAAEFGAALAVEPAYEPARQALVALRLEQAELDAAEQLLNDGLALAPQNAQFATVLSRLRVERGDYDGALELLTRTADAGANDAEHQLLLGTLLQRAGRDKEAVVAFENAARIAEPLAAGWVAMGISYENVGSKALALRAYRQSLAAAPTAEVRSYAESRIRALK